ncbi:MAG: polyphosphate kinase 2 [Planctomycetota bacterium]|jgi:polyphosphate kinase 2
MGKNSSKSKKNDKGKLSRGRYEKELVRLQVELCHLQAWVKAEGLRVVVIFEGRDAAGKGGVIKRITERVSPRVFRVVALPPPSDREKTQLYLQRYIQHMPAAGEVILFDRSWYNRAAVEPVLGFCTSQETEDFLRTIPYYEKNIVDNGIILLKYFFDISQEVQSKRIHARANDPLKHWKLSPMDVKSWKRWWAFTEAYARMIDRTDTDWAPWYRVAADNKRQARLNCIHHMLSKIPYERIPFEAPELGARYQRSPEIPERIRFIHEAPQAF